MQPKEDFLFQNIKDLILKSREKVFRMVNSTLLLTYWEIGRLIVEDQQQGKSRADYGKYVLKNLSKKLSLEFGKRFDESNLRNMRNFYRTFPICDALRHELSWTHYTLLSRQENEEKRIYYLNESIQNNWNVRELKRQTPFRIQ